MDATIEYRTLGIKEPHVIGDTRIDNVVMNHPVTNLGYRIACRGKSVFFTGDHEPFYNPHPEGHPGHAAAARDIARRQQEIDAAMEGVDALIVDCSYTIEEYPAKQGWGHGTFDGALEMALRVGAKALYCTHHEPTRSDDELETAFAEALARFDGRLGGLRVVLASDGMLTWKMDGIEMVRAVCVK
jgi:ribonuclease BN (tRNA processing enzyme)